MEKIFPESLEDSLLLSFCPGLDDEALVLGLHEFFRFRKRDLFFRSFLENDRDFLGASRFTILDGDVGGSSFCERRTDELFTAVSSYAGHTGNEGDLLSDRRGGEGEDRQGQGCNEFLHK